jgi:hypothetical protein
LPKVTRNICDITTWNNAQEHYNFKACQMLIQYIVDRSYKNVYLKICFQKFMMTLLKYGAMMWIKIFHGQVQVVINSVHTKLLKLNLKQNISNRSYRGALTKLRSWTAPLGIGQRRYNVLHVEQRLCLHCKNIVEDEAHVLLHYPLNDSIRIELLQSWFW